MIVGTVAAVAPSAVAQEPTPIVGPWLPGPCDGRGRQRRQIDRHHRVQWDARIHLSRRTLRAVILRRRPRLRGIAPDTQTPIRRTRVGGAEREVAMPWMKKRALRKA